MRSQGGSVIFFDAAVIRAADMHSYLGPKKFMNEQELLKRLELLKTEHRDLDAAIAALSEAGSADQLQIARLKKRKLRLKDQITTIEDTLLPDIIA